MWYWESNKTLLQEHLPHYFDTKQQVIAMQNIADEADSLAKSSATLTPLTANEYFWYWVIGSIVFVCVIIIMLLIAAFMIYCKYGLMFTTNRNFDRPDQSIRGWQSFNLYRLFKSAHEYEHFLSIHCSFYANVTFPHSNRLFIAAHWHKYFIHCCSYTNLHLSAFMSTFKSAHEHEHFYPFIAVFMQINKNVFWKNIISCGQFRIYI